MFRSTSKPHSHAASLGFFALILNCQEPAPPRSLDRGDNHHQSRGNRQSARADKGRSSLLSGFGTLWRKTLKKFCGAAPRLTDSGFVGPCLANQASSTPATLSGIASAGIAPTLHLKRTSTTMLSVYSCHWSRRCHSLAEQCCQIQWWYTSIDAQKENASKKKRSVNDGEPLISYAR